MIKSLVHAADIGNNSRPFEIANEWAKLVIKEFFSQGEQEKKLGLEVTMLCDRETTNFASSQYNFLTFVTLPLF